MDDAGRCANRGCGKPIVRAATGRRAKYCSSTCRVQAKRDRDRQAEEEAERAEALRHARNTIEDLRPVLGETVYGSIGIRPILAELYSAAVDSDRATAADLEGWIARLVMEVNLLAITAREHRAALDTVAELEARAAEQ